MDANPFIYVFDLNMLISILRFILSIFRK